MPQSNRPCSKQRPSRAGPARTSQLVRFERSFIVVENKTNRQSEVQLTFVRLVDLASVEARADDVQLCLSERALHAEHKAVVELGWIVTAVLSITSVLVMAHNSSRRC